MATLVMNESTIALTEEVTENTYVAPTVGTDYIQALSDSLEVNKTREELTRDVLGGTVEMEASRVGLVSVDATIGVEFAANVTEGDAPQRMDLLLKSLLGGKRQITSDQTSGASHTPTRINFADTSAFNVGDICLVKQPGAYECRPISAISTNSYIEFPFALDNGAPSDSVVVAQVTTYYSLTSSSKTLSAEHNIGTSGIKQKASGLRAASMALENWSVGQLPTATFALQGLALDREDADAAASADFTADALPPVTLSACVWLGGNKLAYTEASLNIENTVSFVQSACSANGKIGTRITEQSTNFSFNPDMSSTDLTKTWDKFNNNTDVSVFGYAYNPSTTTGEGSNYVAFWIPQGKITECPVVDKDGIAGETVSVKAHRSSGNDSIFLGFI